MNYWTCSSGGGEFWGNLARFTSHYSRPAGFEVEALQMMYRSFELGDEFLPIVIIPGAARAATTSLFYLLNRHPQIYMSSTKETNYFSQLCPEAQGGEGIPLRLYKLLFAGRSGERHVGEVSPSYLPDPDVARRIKATIPRCQKIIITLRSPIARSVSDFNYLNPDPAIDIDEYFATAIEQYRAGQRDGDNHTPAVNLLKSFYLTQVKSYLDVFGADQVLVILFKDLVECPDLVQQRLWNFLGVKALALPMPISNQASRAARPSAATRRALGDVFESDILRTQELLGRDLSHWLDDAGPSPSPHAWAQAADGA